MPIRLFDVFTAVIFHVVVPFHDGAFWSGSNRHEEKIEEPYRGTLTVIDAAVIG